MFRSPPDSSAEIREILWNKDILDAREWHDKDHDSDIVVYKETEWAWMDDETKSGRIDKYKDLNFSGVSDWAIGLNMSATSSLATRRSRLLSTRTASSMWICSRMAISTFPRLNSCLHYIYIQGG